MLTNVYILICKHSYFNEFLGSNSSQTSLRTTGPVEDEPTDEEEENLELWESHSSRDSEHDPSEGNQDEEAMESTSHEIEQEERDATRYNKLLDQVARAHQKWTDGTKTRVCFTKLL